MNTEEKWVAVVGYEGLYKVSNQGRVRSLDRVVEVRTKKRVSHRMSHGRILKASPNQDGYPTVDLHRDGRSRTVPVHRLVLEAFIGPRPEGHECRHLDGNPKNNRVENVTWGTREENLADMVRHDTIPKGEHHCASKLTADDVIEIRELAARKVSLRKIAAQFGVTSATIGDIVHGRTWAWVKNRSQ